MKQASPSMTYKSCVKPKNLTTSPWADSCDECVWTAKSSTGTDIDVQATGCQMGKNFGMTSDIHVRIHVVDSEHGTGSFDINMTGNGQTMHGHATCIRQVDRPKLRVHGLKMRSGAAEGAGPGLDMHTNAREYDPRAIPLGKHFFPRTPSW